MSLANGKKWSELFQHSPPTSNVENNNVTKSPNLPKSFSEIVSQHSNESSPDIRSESVHINNINNINKNKNSKNNNENKPEENFLSLNFNEKSINNNYAYSFFKNDNNNQKNNKNNHINNCVHNDNVNNDNTLKNTEKENGIAISKSLPSNSSNSFLSISPINLNTNKNENGFSLTDDYSYFSNIFIPRFQQTPITQDHLNYSPPLNNNNINNNYTSLDNNKNNSNNSPLMFGFESNDESSEDYENFTLSKAQTTSQSPHQSPIQSPSLQPISLSPSLSPLSPSSSRLIKQNVRKTKSGKEVELKLSLKEFHSSVQGNSDFISTSPSSPSQLSQSFLSSSPSTLSSSPSSFSPPKFIKRKGEGEEEASNVLWIGNVGPSVSEDDLKSEFSLYGKICNLRILRDRFCAFATFENTNDAVQAKYNLDGEIFGNQYILIHFRPPQGMGITTGSGGNEGTVVTNPPSNSLWVGNISEGVTKSEIEEEFGKYAEVESIRLLRNCAFINFFTVEDATKALENLQGKLFRSMFLKINFAKVKSDINVNNSVNNNHNHNHYNEENSNGKFFSSLLSDFNNNLHFNNNVNDNDLNNCNLDEKYCKICKENINDTRLIPCNHIICSNCYENVHLKSLYKKETSICPLCKFVIQFHLPIFS